MAIGDIDDKGGPGNECASKVCTNRPAVGYNRSTGLWHCIACSHILNRENKAEADALYGGPLVLLPAKTPTLPNMYKTSFERLNFGFDPPLVQSADVVFTTNIPYDDEHIADFLEAAETAMWQQNPHWRDPHGPIAGRAGWSSVLGGRKFTKL